MTKHLNEAITGKQASKKRLALAVKSGVTRSLTYSFLLIVLASSAVQADSKLHHKKDKNLHLAKTFTHTLTMQLSDSLGYPVDGTQFPLTVKIMKEGEKVTLQFPPIAFVTGSVSTANPLFPSGGPIAGGYLYTTSGFLPKCARPSELMPQSIVAASNNGLSSIYLNSDVWFTTPSVVTNPPSGYIVQVTNAGAIQIQGAGTFGNIIPPGPQNLLPISITYFIEKTSKLCKNSIISSGTTNITSFTGNNADNGIRDSHVNDVYNNTAAWAWTDNSTVPESLKNTGTLNAMVAVGSSQNNELSVRQPTQLTDLLPGVLAWTTAVAIIRDGPYKGNIVASWCQLGAPANATLTINSPGSIAGTYVASAGILSPVPFDLTNLPIIPADPLNADTPLVNNLTGAIALVAADNFATGSLNKSNNAFNAGAAGVIIFNDVDALVGINGSTRGPVVSVGHNVGIDILNNLPVTGGIASNGAALQPVRYRAISKNNGLSWTINGPLNIQPTGTGADIGDNGGVRPDKYGNVWYGSTNRNDDFGNLIDQPVLLASSDGGDSYSTVYTFPNPQTLPNGFAFDFPQYSFGNYQDQYGLWICATFLNFDADVNMAVAFIPIYGFGSWGTTSDISFTLVNGLTNSIQLPVVAASNDGRAWFQGVPGPGAYILDGGFPAPYSYINPLVINYKSPGLIDQNYSGSLQYASINNFVFNNAGTFSGQLSYPGRGYLAFSAQSLIFDDKRQALYSLQSFQTPDTGQNMRLAFALSRDNGLTWSEPLDISSTDFANRGYQSMALDDVTGDLVFGWYDGRNDPTFEGLEYYGAILPAKKLDCLVNKIPLSSVPDPVFSIPAAITGAPQTKRTSVTEEKKKELRKKFEKRKHSTYK